MSFNSVSKVSLAFPKLKQLKTLNHIESPKFHKLARLNVKYDGNDLLWTFFQQKEI